MQAKFLIIYEGCGLNIMDFDCQTSLSLFSFSNTTILNMVNNVDVLEVVLLAAFVSLCMYIEAFLLHQTQKFKCGFKK